MKRNYNYLLGADSNNEIVFADINIYDGGEKPTIGISFDTNRPFNASNVDVVDYFDDWCYGMDDDFLYRLCVKFDCAPSELAANLADECNDIRDAMDCSLFPEMYIIDGDDWCFESGCCGQHDTRINGMKEYTNKEAYDIIHQIWDNYHLKVIDDDIIKQIENIGDMLDEIDEEEWITDYIERHIDEF